MDSSMAFWYSTLKGRTSSGASLDTYIDARSMQGFGTVYFLNYGPVLSMPGLQ